MEIMWRMSKCTEKSIDRENVWKTCGKLDKLCAFLHNNMETIVEIVENFSVSRPIMGLLSKKHKISTYEQKSFPQSVENVWKTGGKHVEKWVLSPFWNMGHPAPPLARGEGKCIKCLTTRESK
jgi:hypothetical protein